MKLILLDKWVLYFMIFLIITMYCLKIDVKSILLVLQFEEGDRLVILTV